MVIPQRWVISSPTIPMGLLTKVNKTLPELNAVPLSRVWRNETVSTTVMQVLTGRQLQSSVTLYTFTVGDHNSKVVILRTLGTVTEITLSHMYSRSCGLFCPGKAAGMSGSWTNPT